MPTRPTDQQSFIVYSGIATAGLRMRRGFGYATVVVLLLACAGSAGAQTFRGTILGTITDLNGAMADIMSDHGPEKK